MTAAYDDPTLILTTGGAIDKVYFDEPSVYQIGEAAVERILQTGGVAKSFEIVEVMRNESLEVTDAERAEIVAHVANTTARKIIITHGTDTMTETARALRAIRDKVIVLVGALSPARLAERDAMFNIGMAFAAAQVVPPGVYISR